MFASALRLFIGLAVAVAIATSTLDLFLGFAIAVAVAVSTLGLTTTTAF